MAKIFFFDADGVTLEKHEYFSERYSRDHGVPLEDIVPFFKNEYRQCQVGKADLTEVLPSYLEKWGWKGTIEEFMEYWFTTDTIPSSEVLEVVERLRGEGHDCYLTTDQEKYRAAFIEDELGFKNIFTGCFFSFALCVSKDDPQFFAQALQTITADAKNVTYFDDDIKNVEAAKMIGIDAHFYDGSASLNIAIDAGAE